MAIPVNGAHRIEVISKIDDARAIVKKKEIESLGFAGKIKEVHVIDVYTFDHDFSPIELAKISDMLVNPVTQIVKVDSPSDIRGDWVIEIGFLPGVTDNVGNTVQEGLEDLFNKRFDKHLVFTSQMIVLSGDISAKDASFIGNAFANSLIQRISIKDKEKYLKEEGMDCIVPQVRLTGQPSTSLVDLNSSDEELVKLGKEGIANPDGSRRGPLALDLESMKTIQDYFLKVEKRMPTDIELESIAQTWSEHCKHTIFANELDEIKEGIFKACIKKATNKISAERGYRDFCISVFEDNAGGIIFDENYLVTDKVETHNSPSALDPFGGSITGIVGVNRDAIGFGKGSLPIINRYGFCFGYPEDTRVLFRGKDKTNPALSPLRIMNGVIEGVKVGGNCSGIPTPQGFVYFDDSYRGKPLVFVGTLGLIPRSINGKEGHVKKARAGDYVVMVGGKVGKDGIHGATFSSEAMDSGSPATAVQIGDPITQKKLSDAIVKEARDLELYNSITDNGAGGISCSVAEMAKECGGFIVDLERVPVKYPGIQPWEIWVSESQERMTLSVSQDKWFLFKELMDKRGVESTVIGEFTDSGRAIVNYDGKKILDLDMKFLHDGVPKKLLRSEIMREVHGEPNFPCPNDLNKVLIRMISRHNVAGFGFISRQYDHEVQAGSILKPLQGEGEVNAYATVTRPLYDSKKAVVTSQALNPRYSEIDTYHMAACAIDTAIKNAVCTGCSIDKIALLDNFCWCSSTEPKRLWQLKMAAEACYDYSLLYKTPFISGKDSMFNDFKGFDESGNPIKISVQPTLLISSLGVIDDYEKAISLDAKFAEDIIYVLGETKNEMGGSEYFDMAGKELLGEPFIGDNVPKVDGDVAYGLYKKFHQAAEKGIIASSIPVNFGGLGVALVKMCIAGKLGASINLSGLKRDINVSRDDFALFSESQSRMIVTVAPEKQKEFEEIFAKCSFSKLGEITDKRFTIMGLRGNTIVDLDLEDLNKEYKKTFGRLR
ncbi:MAG: AIR synthase-related protein [Nanoarchaeota archaeon]|nr:AIR synthase-related protein [Nanoarchaeota archaeon]